MRERLLLAEHDPLPSINLGEVIRKTPNFQVVTDYKPGLENTRAGERFFLEPLTITGGFILFNASKAHNIYNFNHRPVGLYTFPCLRADYIQTNVSVLLKGEVQIPKTGEDTVPSPDRMEACLAKGGVEYTFADDLPIDFGIPNPDTRHLRMLQVFDKDTIPNEIVHSPHLDQCYKVRKTWWYAVLISIDLGIDSGEFADPELIKKMQAFRKKYKTREFFDPNNLTTSENIQEVNALINKIWETYGKGKA